MTGAINKARLPWQIISLSLALILSLGVISHFVFVRLKTSIKTEVQGSLSAIADLKAGQISNWQKGLFHDAGTLKDILLESPQITGLMNDPSSQEAIKKIDAMSAKLLARHPEFNDIFIVNRSGRRITAESTIREEIPAHFLEKALSENTLVFSDLYLSASTGKVQSDIILPLVKTGKQNTAQILFFVLRIDPGVTLYPLIQKWPTPSKTAETLLVRRDGDHIIFLNELRHRKHTALVLELPTASNVAAATAITGKKTVLESFDYRGEEIVAATRPIPGTPWFIVAKIDKSEIYSPVRSTFFFVLTITFAMIITGISALILFWYRNQSKNYETLYITELERDKAKKQLNIIESKYTQLFEAAHEGIWAIDAENKTTLVNKRIAEMLGYTVGEMNGMSLFDFMNEEGKKDAFEKLARRKQGVGEQHDFTFRRKDGSFIHTTLGASPITDENGKYAGAFAVVTDVTHNKLVESELEKRSKFLQELIDAMPNPIYYEDANLKYIGCNKSFEHTMGLDRNKVIGETVFDVADRSMASVYNQKDNELLTKGGTQIYETKIKDGRGLLRDVIFYKALFFNPDGALGGIIGTFMDITERKKNEREKENMQAQLLQTGKLAALGQMAAGIAHELNNPLTIIMGNAQYLKEKQEIDEPLKQIFIEIDQASQRCKNIVADLLEFSRLKETDFEKCAINNVIENSLHLASYQSEFKNIEVQKQLAADLPPTMANKSRLEQVFINIAINASHSMPKGGLLTVTSAYNPSTNNVEICFKDTGEGIPAANMSVLFDPFFTTKKKGTGLGLAISLKIIQLHGGFIKAESEGPGKGSLFTVTLPVFEERTNP